MTMKALLILALILTASLDTKAQSIGQDFNSHYLDTVRISGRQVLFSSSTETGEVQLLRIAPDENITINDVKMTNGGCILEVSYTNQHGSQKAYFMYSEGGRWEQLEKRNEHKMGMRNNRDYDMISP